MAGQVFETIHVEASGSYDVVVGRGLLADTGRMARKALDAADNQVLLVSDDNVAPLYASVVVASFQQAGFVVHVEVLPAGERTKSLQSYGRLLEAAAEGGLSRQSTVVALGGGVIGDLAGFVAATYMRGCNLIQIATSLLAMVDSSVGGKTAIDLPQGKNLAGAFHQPALVVCDLDCLATLSPQYLSDGMGEVVKYGVMADEELFGWLEKPLAGQEEQVVARCIAIKRDIVEQDERESGIRKLLNLGHTAGHSIELLSSFRVSHGHAVAAGIAIMARACASRGWCSPHDARRVEDMLAVHGLPTGSSFLPQDLARCATRDKKRVADHIDIVTVGSIGASEVKRVSLEEFSDLMYLGCCKPDVVVAEEGICLDKEAKGSGSSGTMVVEPRRLHGIVDAISSKSAAHRMLICAALADGPTDVVCTTSSKDIEATIGCLQALGASVERMGTVLRVTPVAAGRISDTPVLDCCESGSTLRFLLPVVCALGFHVALDGSGRLPERPLSPLREELEAHGARLSPVGTWPLEVKGKLQGNSFIISGGVSSQYVTGLLLAIPLLGGGGCVKLTGRIESRPYIDMTMRVMAAFGIQVTEYQEELKTCDSSVETVTCLSVAPGARYVSPGSIRVEGDWSNAAFWLCAGALGDEPVTVRGLDLHSAQGDMAILDILESFGASVVRDYEGMCVTISPGSGTLRGISLDAGDVPDLVPVVSVVAACAAGTTHICNAGRLRIKESDRLQTTSELLERLGVDLEELPEGLVIHGRGGLVEGRPLRGGRVRSHNDHRLAMSAAVASIGARGSVAIEGSGAVAKSYPGFFDDFRLLGGCAVLEKEEN